MRLKIIAGNLLAIVLVGLVGFFIVRTQIQTGLAADIDAAIGNDRQLFDRSWRLSGLEFVRFVSDRAATQQVTDVFGGLDENSRRRRAHDAANRISQWFRDPSRGRGEAPDLVAICDDTGRVLARDQDPNRMYQAQLAQQLPTLMRVIAEGTPNHDVWHYQEENKVFQTGMAPIRSAEGAIIGGLIVAYDLSNGLAQSESELLGRDVAFVVAGKVYSSSLSGEGAEALRGYLFGADQAHTTAALDNSSTPPSAFSTDLAGDQYIGMVTPLPMAPSAHVAYVVMANKSEKMALAGQANIILILAGLGALLVLVYGFIIGTSLLKPVEQIEEGVLRVINGQTDFRLDVKSAEFGGLAYRINQLINVFTGVSEEDDEGRVSQPPSAVTGGAAWRAAEFSAEAGAAAAAGGAAPQPAAGGGAGDAVDDPQVAATLAAEPEAAYLNRVFQEYVAAKSAIGENVSNIPQDRFIQRLQANAAALTKKHGCREVRFQVHTAGNQVALRPVLIR